MLTRGGRGVKNPENLADVICERPLRPSGGYQKIIQLNISRTRTVEAGGITFVQWHQLLQLFFRVSLLNAYRRQWDQYDDTYGLMVQYCMIYSKNFVSWLVSHEL